MPAHPADVRRTDPRGVPPVEQARPQHLVDVHDVLRAELAQHGLT